MGESPAVDGAGGGKRRRRAAHGKPHVGRPGSRRLSYAKDAKWLAPVPREQPAGIATKPRHVRVDDAQSGNRGQRRFYGITAVAQDGKTGACGVGMWGRDKRRMRLG
jgi:hypothetical protein